MTPTRWIPAFGVMALATSASVGWSPMALAAQSLTVQCGSSGQVCANAAAFKVSAPGGVPVRVRLQTPSSHCSDVRYTVTPALGPSQTTAFLTPPQTNPATASQVVNLGPLVKGDHAFLITATGRVGGCNSGRLGSWGVVITP